LNRIKLFYALIRAYLAQIIPGQEGSILTGVLLTVLAVVILGVMLPALWPMLLDSITNINAIEGSDTATAFLKVGWPIAILVIGVGVVAGLIFYALRQFGVIGGKGKGKGAI